MTPITRLTRHNGTAALLFTVSAIVGCAHTELRTALDMPPCTAMTESNIRRSVIKRFPIGVDFREVRAAFQPAKQAPRVFVASPWTVVATDTVVHLESQDALPEPPGQASWMVVELKASDGKLYAVEVYRKVGAL